MIKDLQNIIYEYLMHMYYWDVIEEIEYYCKDYKLFTKLNLTWDGASKSFIEYYIWENEE